MVDFTEMPYAEDFAEELAILMDHYMGNGMSANTAKAVLMAAMTDANDYDEDEDEED